MWSARQVRRSRCVEKRNGRKVPRVHGKGQRALLASVTRMAESPLKVGELAERAGVGVQTLHYYERVGLLPQPDRSASNYRLYQSEALRRVQFIKKAQSLGFTLEEIKEILGLRGQGRAPCRCVADVGKKHLQELDARIAALQEFRRALAAVVPNWEKETSRH